MIDTIIFDIGNVLMKFESRPYIKRMLKDEHAIKAVTRAVFGTGYWDELDLGIDPDKVFAKMIATEPKYEEEIRLILANIDQGMGRQDYARPWIREMKDKGYRVLYLSNYSEYVMDSKWEVLDFLPLMDGGVFSCHVGMIKPDPAIFTIICDRYDLDPARCVFIDDNEANIKTAQEYGMKTVHFKGYDKAREELSALLEEDRKRDDKQRTDEA